MEKFEQPQKKTLQDFANAQVLSETKTYEGGTTKVRGPFLMPVLQALAETVALVTAEARRGNIGIGGGRA